MSNNTHTTILHGMRRSGNCYFMELAENNYNVTIDRYANHLTIPRDPEGPLNHMVVMVRNPLSWLPSLYRLMKANAWIHPDMDFATWSEGDWMQSDRPNPRWQTCDGARMRWEGRRGYCPRICDWNRTCRYWMEQPAHIIRYEDLVVEPEREMVKLAETLGLAGTRDEFFVPGEYVAPDASDDRIDEGREGVLRRLNQKTYLNHWTEAGLNVLRKTADPDVLDELGYSLEANLGEAGPLQPIEGDDEPEPAGNQIYWIMRGGAGDMVMLAHGMKKVLNAGYKIDLYTGSPHSSWLSPLLEGWDGLTVLDERPEDGAHYDVVACDCPSSTLKDRTDHMSYDVAISPSSFSGTPAEWGDRLANQILDHYGDTDADRSSLYNVLCDQLPHPRRPEKVLIGTGVGNDSEEKAQKKWAIENWRQVCESAAREFVFLGCETGCDHPVQWGECPICGAALECTDFDDGHVPCMQACSGGCGWAVRDLIGKTPHITDVTEQMARGALYVGVDNGLGHLAAACGLPTITVFGGTRADRYRPNTCNSLTFGDKGDPPEAGPVAEAVENMFADYQVPQISMVIATCNEGEELLRTVECARLKAGCPIEVIVVNDGGDDGSVERCPDWVRTTSNPSRTGVAPARNQGAEMARGPVLIFWDGHMRWSTGCGREMARKAMEEECAVMAPLRNLYGSGRMFGGAEFELKEGRKRLGSTFVGVPSGDRYHSMGGFVAPCYAIPRNLFERVGGWPSGLKNWGQTEITLSLRLTMSGVDILMDSEVTMWHMFRGSFSDAGYSGVSLKDVHRNNYRMCRICFDEDTFQEFWLPLMRQERHFDESCEEWDEQDEADRDHTRELKVVSDEEFFQEVLGMSVEEAKDHYL